MDYEMGVDTKWVVAMLKKKFRLGEPKEVEEVRIRPAVPVGENFMSIVFRVTVKCRLLSGRCQKTSIIVKYFRSTGTAVDVLSVYDSVRSEVKIYNILPMFDDLMEEFDDRREKLWCDCYGYLPFNTIALEDLEVYGYEMMNRKQTHSLEIIVLILREMARYHAMSKVLLSRGIITQGDGGNHFLYTDTPAFREFMPGAFQVLSSVIKESWEPQWQSLASKLEKEIPVVCEKLKCLMESYDPRFEVLNHGDIWTNNVMLKFTEYDRTPISVRFIDFQFSVVHSFALDIAYYLYCCTKPSMRREKWRLLMKTYQESLEKNLKFYKFEGYIPTLDDVIGELDRVGYLALVILVYNRPVQSGSSEVTFDLANVLTKSPFEFFNKTIYTEDKYAKEVSTELQELVNKGVI